MERKLFLKPPKEAGEEKGVVWELIKAVYGLIDSPEKWYQRVVDIMVGKLGGEQCPLDKGLFVWRDVY